MGEAPSAALLIFVIKAGAHYNIGEITPSPIQQELLCWVTYDRCLSQGLEVCPGAWVLIDTLGAGIWWAILILMCLYAQRPSPKHDVSCHSLERIFLLIEYSRGTHHNYEKYMINLLMSAVED